MRFSRPLILFFAVMLWMGRPVYAQGPLQAAEGFLQTETPDTTKPALELLSQTDSTAVVAAAIPQKSGQVWDVYLYLKNNNGWEVRDVRSLARTELLYVIKRELEKLSPGQIDSIIRAPDGDRIRLFESRNDYYYELGHVRLTLASDADIMRHFREHESEFGQLKDDFMNAAGPTGGLKIFGLGSPLRYRLRDLFLQSVEAPYGSLLKFVIGGVVDNYVGYLYATDPDDVPPISPDGYIVIRPMGNGWYMFKTT